MSPTRAAGRFAATGWLAALLGMAVLGGAAAAAAEKSSEATIQNSMDVGMEYTLTVDGAVVDSTEGKGLFHYIHGQGQIIPGLERQLAGLKINDAKEVTVKPEEGYGTVDPAAYVEVSKSQLPAGTTPAVGMPLQGVNPSGQSFRAVVSEVKGETVVLNLNHPLAGKTLNFKVKISSIAPAKVPAAPAAPASP
ncbi:MAG: peptidylprolyl isomerase [Candidatus Omnitrophica bacterium]|nr:peptidylprolyl isomerase [Candidatus Omnitrophota bacterium]